MTKSTENSDPQVVVAINQAIDLAANDKTSLAVQLLTDLVAEFPGASAVHDYLAWFLSESGRHEEAIKHSQVAIELAPKSESASLVHFHVLWKADQRVQSLDEMKRFMTIGYSEEYANIARYLEPNPEPKDG